MALRRGRGLPDGKKVLLVLDQFEQFLHARPAQDASELVAALRQCDGEHVQAIVLVRDDFWMAVTRFLQELEVELVPGSNVAAVDLFDVRHARKVLEAFGRAFAALPEAPGRPSTEQERFLDQAAAGLARDGKVISVRLALFAEMVKGKSWVPATLREVGGVEGVGVSFLEETFSSATANPKHRLHQKAAQAVLKVLLPEAGSDIKGNMRSLDELRQAAGDGSRPRDFEELLRILDSELRLITPTDPEGHDADVSPTRQRGTNDTSPTRQRGNASVAAQYYQLTHDYLVPSLRDWLTRKQKQTRRGRAELWLAERAAMWNVNQANRHLPYWWEWLNIRLFTRKKDWTPTQRTIMRKAGLREAIRALLLGLALVCVVVSYWELHGRLRAQALLGNLLHGRTEDVPEVAAQMAPYRP